MTFGDTTNWDDIFKQNLVPMVLDYIITSWEQMPKIGPSDLEDDITDRLYVKIVNAKNRNHFPILIRREDLEFDLSLGKETGRKDIVFYPSSSEEIYLCLEAKRLNAIISGKKYSLADQYVKEGMQRYVDRKYSRYVQHGIMLAYVLDGNISGAIGNIEKEIYKRLTELHTKNKGFVTSTIRPEDPYTKETRHHRSKEKTVFSIHHIFVTNMDNIQA